uniref:Uncharacterized protein n=1 Tax=Vitis vinifera TaxID=29760 RepID=A5BQC0_VITVI|nr:hypothetical protein VITISV_008300 [Vitis vinifera]
MPSIGLTPKATSSTPPTTSRTPPVVPATSAPHPSESTIVISISEFRGLCHTLETLTATQSILAQQMAVFLLYDSYSMSLKRYHFLPIVSIALATLRAMLSLVGGKVEEGSFVINAKLF